MSVVSITRLRVRSWRYIPQFAWFSFRSRQQAIHTAGNRGVRLLREPGNVFWTATLWDSDEDVRRFMIAGAHGKVMRHLMTWCDEAAVVRWHQQNAELPTWEQARSRMQSEGRRSKVHHPSPAHERFEIPPLNTR